MLAGRGGKMIKIRLLKNWRTKKIGDIINISEKGGASMVKAETGEYVLEPKKENEETYYEILKNELEKPKIKKYIGDNLKNNEGFFIEHFGERVVKILSIISYIKKNPEKYKEAWLKWSSKENEKIVKEKNKEISEEIEEEKLLEHKEKIFDDKEVQSLLKNKDFLEVIDKEFDKKIVREHEARKTILMVANMCNVENKTKATDNLMLNSASGVGKDYVSEAIFEIFPEEEKEELIRITPKVLAYTRNKLIDPKATWKKIRLRMEDVGNDVLNDDCFKVMSSAHPNKINKSKSVNKGKIIENETEGKPSIIITIANPNPREEILRRYPICSLDAGINQTKEILKRQAEFAKQGETADYNPKITEALRCLKRIKVKIPFADKLVKIFCPENAIVRTHFPRFLDYIKSSCAFFQFQRKNDNDGFFLAEEQDYSIARMMLKKTTSNILMIPLTELLKKILKVFEIENLQKKSVDDLGSFKEIQKLNIDKEWLRRKLNFLASKGFLLKDSEKRINEAGKIIPKPINIYSFNKLQKLIIPKWNDISSFTSNYYFTPNSSNSLNTEVNEVFEVKSYKRSINKKENPLIQREMNFSHLKMGEHLNE